MVATVDACAGESRGRRRAEGVLSFCMVIAFFGGRSGKLRCWLRGRQGTGITVPWNWTRLELDVPK
jgi:hypothetical protein